MIVGVVLVVAVLLLVASRGGAGAHPAAPSPPVSFRSDSPPAAPPTFPSSAPTSLSALLATLVVAPEHLTGYDRDLFPHWIDADGDGCNTRYEVLIDEAVVAPSISGSCHLTGGSWLSPYDGQRIDDASRVQIDHLVPLAEAWYSGAFAWTTARRQDYANDLGVPWTLAAVSGQTNEAKGSSDPASWLPPRPDAVCPYLESWIGVKTRWSLTVDPDEKAALTRLLKRCPDSTVVVPIVPQPAQ